MPLLKGKPLAPAKSLVNMGPTDVVYVIPHTSEQFLCKEEFEKRQALYKEPVWTCQSTGVTKLSHKEAMESEKRICRLLKDGFPHVFEKQILELVHHSTCSLEGLVDEAWRNLHEFFTIGEYVTLKVKAHGRIMRGVIVKIEPTVADKPVAEDGPSLSTSPKDTDSPRKAPKLRPCKYGVRIDGEDKIINSIPAGELVREAKLPKKDLIRFFIRTHAMRSGHQPSSQWVVSEQMVSQHLLQGKPCAVLGSLPERPDNQLKENVKKSKKRAAAKGPADENCKPSKKRKLDLSEKHEKKTKNKPISSIQRTINLVASQSGLNLKTSSEANASQATKDPCLPDDTKVLKTPGKITAFVNGLKRSDSVSSSSSEVPLAKLKDKILDKDTPSTTPIKQSLSNGSGKKKSVIESPRKPKVSASDDSTKIATTNNFLEDDDSSFDVPLAKLRDVSRASGASEPVFNAKKGSPESKKSKNVLGKEKGSGMKSSSVILYRLASPKSGSKKDDRSASPKKRLKQMTLFDMKGGRKDDNDRTPRKTPEKIPDSSSPKKPVKKTPPETQKKTPSNSSSAKKSSPKTSEKTPPNGASRTTKETPKKSSESSIVKKVATPVKPTPRKSLPPIVLRLQKANKVTNVHLYRMLLSRCAKELTDHQIRALPQDLRAVILPKFNQLKEKKRLEQMTPAEREAHMLKKKEELRQHLKNKFAESRRRYEDTELDLQPLPSPKIVLTPDGLANELFGDVAMVAEFISCFRGLLMPSDSNSITSEKLMTALVAGKEGFTYLSNILCILLQTLLQDKLAEDYRELRVPLSEIPVSEFTASEMVRLCLRRFDADADSVDGSSSGDFEEIKLPEDNEVSEELIEQLESNEFYELEVESKVQILVGLCNRIVGTYSVQDYMDEKQQESAELWKRRIAEQKARKDKKKTEKKQTKTKKSDVDDKKSPDEESSKLAATKNSAAAGLTLDHFYGDKTKSVKPVEAGSTEDAQEDTEDMLSAIKRRRKAAEERKQKESEERLIKEKEKSEIQQQKEDLLFENQFKKGVAMAKSVLRHSPVGLDRHHNRYWILHASQPGLYVEKGWASRESDYTVRLDASSSSESDSDGRSTESGIQSGSSDLNKDSACEKTVPPVGQNLWFMFDSVEDVTMLVEGLHPLGVRESALKEALKKHVDSVINRLKSSSAKAVENGSKDSESKDGDVLLQGLREEMQDLEMRLVHGGLGGVSDLATWEKKMSEAREIKDFVECLIDIQIHVLPKFIKGLLASQSSTRKKNPVDNHDEIKSEENEEIVVEKRKDFDGAKVWLDALQHCGTFSRLHVLMGIFESCIKWEKSAENMKCRICRKKGDDEFLLLCDECNMPFHLFCLRPVLAEVPIGEWYCPACSPERSSLKSRLRFRSAKEEDESEDEDEGIADIEHEQECAICGEESDLIQCSTCPSSFHMDCHEPPIRHMPRLNTWKCIQCKTGVRLRKSRRKKTQKRKHYIDYVTDEDELEEVVPTKKFQKSTTISDLRRNETPEPRDTGSRRRSQDDDAGASRPARLTDRESKKTVVSKTREMTKAQDLERGSGAASKANSKSNPAKSDEEPKSSRVGRRGDVKTTQKSTTPKDAVNKQAILDLIDRLRKHRNSWPFLEPVDATDAPDYYAIVLDPIDLRTMEDKCISDVYTSPNEVISDFRLMLQNAERYNEVDSPVGKCVAPLDKFFESIFSRYIPSCQYQSRKWFGGRSQ